MEILKRHKMAIYTDTKGVRRPKEGIVKVYVITVAAETPEAALRNAGKHIFMYIRERDEK